MDAIIRTCLRFLRPRGQGDFTCGAGGGGQGARETGPNAQLLGAGRPGEAAPLIGLPIEWGPRPSGAPFPWTGTRALGATLAAPPSPGSPRLLPAASAPGAQVWPRRQVQSALAAGRLPSRAPSRRLGHPAYLRVQLGHRHGRQSRGRSRAAMGQGWGLGLRL